MLKRFLPAVCVTVFALFLQPAATTVVAGSPITTQCRPGGGDDAVAVPSEPVVVTGDTPDRGLGPCDTSWGG
ncbi:hypothetical protein AB0M39_07935 [Streptomyces sp. NPDC051907]|uniref:hypothetical protein n=1 Tax=Streptomyces sp. NPDC051907 TaxID=3155284 RepID=UPI003413944E